MTERTTQGSELQALDSELVSQLKAGLELELRAEFELRAQLDQARAEQGELEDRREALAVRVKELEKELEELLGERPNAAGRVRTRRGDHRARGGAYTRVRGLSSADLVVDLLKSVGEPLHYRDIYEELKTNEFFRAAGPGSLGDVDPAATLLSRFFKDPRLYRPRRGTYALVEWLDRKDDQPTDDLPGATDRLAATRHLIRDGKSQFRWDHDVLGAAERALRDEDAPMRPSDLTKKMIAMGTWKPLESTPKNVVSQRLSKDISEKGERSRFRRVRYGLYGLSEWGDSE